MMNIKKYETTRKGVMALIRTIDIASKEADTLDEKLKMQSALREFQLMDLAIKKHYYLIEDAIALEKKATFCDECHSQL